MKEFGDCIGICLHYQTADEQAGDIAEDELKKNPKKKKEQLINQFKKDYNLQDQIRALIFKEGVCISSSDQQDKDKIKLKSKCINHNTVLYSGWQVPFVHWG